MVISAVNGLDSSGLVRAVEFDPTVEALAVEPGVGGILDPGVGGIVDPARGGTTVVGTTINEGAPCVLLGAGMVPTCPVGLDDSLA